MRQYSLPERAWRRLNWLGIESGNHTEVSGDTNGSVQSGTFSGPMGQGGNVTINMPSTGRRIRGRRPRREPRSDRQFLKALWLLQVEGDRQSRAWRQFASRWLMALTVGILISLGGWMAVAVQWQIRFGWIWGG